ncbi:MAG: ABC transporter permease subunit [Actinomycetota bacterium]|jgi:ABC-type dipeptide/oligopeptide/nickel transport system permease subunit|nr:ABC transporter permease subunit [Actinomycetota bacterium]
MALETASQVEHVADEDVHADVVAPHRPLLRRLLDDRLAAVGLAIVAFFVLAAVFAPLLAPHDPSRVNATSKLLGSSWEHPLGTDELGRDTLSRLLFGARWSLGAAAVACLIVMTIGVVVGTIAGYYGGWIDGVLMRVVDVLLAFPPLILYLAIVGTLGVGLRNLMIALVSISWVSYARVVRGLVVVLRERGFVRASRALGARDRRLMWRHILPNVVPPVVVLASLQIGGLILTLAALGFFGLGVTPPTPEWGSMINQSRLFLQTSPALMIWPGLAISLTVIGFNLLGDGLRDVLDPRVARVLPHR